MAELELDDVQRGVYLEPLVSRVRSGLTLTQHVLQQQAVFTDALQPASADMRTDPSYHPAAAACAAIHIILQTHKQAQHERNHAQSTLN